MNRFAWVSLFALSLVFALNCRGRIDYNEKVSVYNEAADNSLNGRAVWMKHKGDALDILVKLRNDYKHPIVIAYEGIKVEQGGDKAYDAQGKAGTFELNPGEQVERLMIYRFEKKAVRTGPVLVTFAKVLTKDEKPKPLKPLVLELPVKK